MSYDHLYQDGSEVTWQSPSFPTLAKMTISHMLLLRLTINPGVRSFKLILLLQTLQGFNRTQCAYKSWDKIYTFAKVSEN